MKKRKSTRIISGFLAVVMVLLMVPVFTIGTVADGVSITNNATYIQEYRMSSSNTSIKVANYIQQREKQTGLTDSFNKSVKKTITFGKNIGSVLSIASMAVNEFQNDNPWYENVGNIALNLVSSYLGIDLSGGPSESEIIIEKLEEMMEEVNEKLDSLSESVNALSSEVKNSTSSLAEYIYYTNKDEQLQRLLDEFAQRNNPNGFSYFRDRDNLNNAYKALMGEYIPIDGSTSGKAIEVYIYDDIVKAKYDKLYEAAMKLEPLYDYIVAEENGFIENKTVQDAFYEKAVLGYYLCSGVNKDASGNAVLPKDNAGNIILPDENIEIKCIDFAKEIYDTYMFSQYALMLCYNYQLEYLTNQTYNDGDEVLHHYYEIEGRKITFGEYIFSDDNDLGIVKKMLDEQDRVKEEIAGYICYVLNLDGNYLYESGAKNEHGEKIDENTVYNPQYKEIFEENSYKTDPFSVKYGDFATKTKYIRLNNKVSQDDILYMNVLPNELASLFASGDFIFTTSNENLATVNNAGVVNVIGASGTFTIKMMYNDVEMYSLSFEIIDRQYSGGMGSEDSPYLISCWEDINKLIDNEHYLEKNIHFKLVNDIGMSGHYSFSGIPDFYGHFDGNGHRIYNFDITSSSLYVGFIGSLKAGAVVENLTIGQENTDADVYSVNIKSNVGTVSTLHVGAIAGENMGTIHNCLIEDVYVFGSNALGDSSRDYAVMAYVGGITGANYGTEDYNGVIQGCSVINCYVQGNSSDGYDNNPARAESKIGGICGYSAAGRIDDCRIENLTMHAYAYSKDSGTIWGSDKNEGDARIFIGYIVGQATKSAIVTNCVATPITSSYSISGDSQSIYVGDFVAYAVGATVENSRLEYRGHTYQLFKNALSWEEAKAHCESIGGHLVTITSAEENEIVHHLVSTNGSKEPWLGGSDVETEGTFVWVTGEAFSYTNWAAGEPNNVDGGQDYMVMYADGSWDDGTTTHTRHYICEWDSNDSVDDSVDDSSNNLESYKQIYVRGETHVTSTDGSYVYPLQNYRIDTSEVGDAKIVKLTQLDGTSVYTKEEIAVQVRQEAVTELRVYTEPTQKIYEQNAEELVLDGLQLVAIYDNGNVVFLNNGDEGVSPKEFSEEFDFSDLGQTDIIFIYQGIEARVSVTVVSCMHANTESREKIEATCGSVGYDAGVYCIDCQAYIDGGAQISATGNHVYGNWSKHDDNQHARTCECGAAEYEDHDWIGEITIPATYEQDGEKTYTCFCGAAYTVIIPKPVSIHRFVVDDARAAPGERLQVKVRLENNPGVALIRLKVSYDSAVLTLDQVSFNNAIGGVATQPNLFDGYVILSWYNNRENVKGDWVFATLSFKVKDTASVGSTSDIVLTYDAEEVCDIEENNVVFSVDNGSVTVLDHVPGDINGDGSLTSKDLLRLARYFAGWDVDVNELALDVNGDGNVNSKDLLRLARYFAGWDVELY